MLLQLSILLFLSLVRISDRTEDDPVLDRLEVQRVAERGVALEHRENDFKGAFDRGVEL